MSKMIRKQMLIAEIFILISTLSERGQFVGLVPTREEIEDMSTVEVERLKRELEWVYCAMKVMRGGRSS